MITTNTTYHNSLNSFCIVGINFRKNNVSVRSKFSLSPEQTAILLHRAAANKVSGCLVLSTCNRTEIYGITNEPNEFAKMLCTDTNNSMEDFLEQSYTFRGLPAIDHLFKVASGLDSQIIGDYEILSQLKHAAKIAKECGCFDSFMERAINYALQVSKEIKTKTQLSSGTISVSYAAIEIIKEKMQHFTEKKILLIGTGKFGNHIAQNLKDYLPGTHISFANRTDEKAAALATEYDAEFVPYKNIAMACGHADIIIVCSGAADYTVLPSFFNTGKPCLILDLSIPQNVDPAVKDIPAISLMNVDEVSIISNKTLALRQAEVPKALNIINDTLNSLEDWHRQQFNNPILRIVKSELFQLSEVYFKESPDNERIHKVISALAIQLKIKKDKGCQCLIALNNYLQVNHGKAS
ncbi:MAG: glutamyl-tRNA reductase [Ginsengibacter sp.]